jgi:DNA methylase
VIALADVTPASLDRVRDAVLDQTPVSIGPRRTASPHEFYRYPARFAPSVAAAVIDAFTEVGDTVADYFVGGGTTLVEARLASRLGIGSDINSLATFVTTVKTRLYTSSNLAEVSLWASQRSNRQRRLVAWPTDECLPHYFRNFDSDEISDQRNIILAALADLTTIQSDRARALARCIVLRTAQWALDMRSEVPTADHIAEAMTSTASQMVAVAMHATASYRTADQLSHAGDRRRSLVIQQGVPGLSHHKAVARYPAPSLVLTSPPYPGVYVNYHRWKLRGRLETPLPYFIAGQHDGHGLAHYTMASRSDRSLDTYFSRLRAAFADIASMCTPKTWVVQVVGFNDVDAQLPRYLRTMSQAGFAEIIFSKLGNSDDGRLWREVPGRRWWASAGDRSAVAPHTAREVLLVHRLT